MNSSNFPVPLFIKQFDNKYQLKIKMELRHLFNIILLKTIARFHALPLQPYPTSDAKLIAHHNSRTASTNILLHLTRIPHNKQPNINKRTFIRATMLEITESKHLKR